MGVRRVDQRCAASPVRLTLVAAIVAGSLVALAPSAGAAVGSMTTFAGGVGWGKATNVAQSPVGVAVLGDRVLEVDGFTRATELPPIGAYYATVVRAIDVRTGQESAVAGNDVGGFSGDGGPAVGSLLAGTGRVIEDASGNVYLSDNSFGRIRKVSVSGIITTVAGTGTNGFSGDGGPATRAQLDRPDGLAWAPDGSLVFSDSGNRRIRRIAPDGTISTIAGDGTVATSDAWGDGGPAVRAQFDWPRDLGYDVGGNLYIADVSRNRIRMITPAGTISTFAVTEGPVAMAVAGPGRVLVRYGSSIRSIDAAGTTTTIGGMVASPGFGGDGGPAVKAQLSDVRGIAVDGAGNVYIADSGNRRVRVVDTAGTIRTVAGNGSIAFGGDGGQAAAARLWSPGLVRTGPSGTYIADRGNERVRRVDAAGVIETVRQAVVYGMAVDAAGNLYLSEYNRIVKRTPGGTVTVIAGNGSDAPPGGDGGLAVAATVGVGPIAVDGSGNVYLAEQRASSVAVRRIDRYGVITVVAGAPPFASENNNYPDDALHRAVGAVRDLAVGADGALYLVTADQILRIWCGVMTRVALDPQIDWDYLLYGPQGLAVDGAGNLFVSVARKVYRITPDGRPSVVGGGGTAPFVDGQTATSADLRNLGAVASDGTGNLLVAAGDRVLKVAGVSAGAATPGPECASPLVPVAPPLEPSSLYQPLTPARILDTRIGTGGVGTAVGPGATISLAVRGVGGVPATAVSSVSLNLTVTQPTAEGYISAFPSGGARPPTSSVNFLPGQTVANLVVAKVGADGRVNIFNATGRSHVVADVVGWFGDSGARYMSSVPSRILDTRNGTGGPVAPVRPGGTISLPFRSGGLPTSGASAVVLNVTVTQPTAEGYVSAFPSGTDRPPTSSVNFLPGHTVANLVVAKVGDNGKVDIYNSTGATHLVVDVVGWYQEVGAPLNAVVPARILDTRYGTGGSSTPLGPDATIALPVTAVGGVPPVGVSAVVLNLTVTQPTAAGYVSVYPAGYSRPLTSSVNFPAGRTVANLVVAQVGSDGTVRIYNVAGTTHVVADVVGWYGEVVYR